MQINIHREQEREGGWTFDAQVVDHAGATYAFSLRLSWADYNLWSPDGAARPEAVAEAALRFMLSREPCAEVSSSFDAARIRRRYTDADEVIPSLIR